MPDELTKIKEQYKTKTHMLVPKITKPTPDETHQANLITDLTEENHPKFAGMCG